MLTIGGRLRIVLLLCFFASSALAGGKDGVLHVTAENPSGFSRPNEIVEVPRSHLAAVIGTAVSPSLEVIDALGGGPLIAQLTERGLLFQASFAPHERKTFVVTLSTGPAPAVASLVDGRFVPPREDYAWENDRIAFRTYGPALAAEVNNGIDVWTKRVRSLIVRKWYKESEAAPPGKDTYHQDRGEGADFFETGRSLGAGGSGLWIDGALRQPGVFVAQRTLMNGPLRVSFELMYRWVLGSQDTVREYKIITLDAGQNLNKIDVRFEGGQLRDSLTLACGLVKREKTKLTQDPARRWIALWGLTNADTANGYLGTGIVFSDGTFDEFTQDAAQYLVLRRVPFHGSFTYYAGAGWTRSGDFSSEADWVTCLDTAAKRLREPLSLRYTDH